MAAHIYFTYIFWRYRVKYAIAIVYKGISQSRCLQKCGNVC